MTAQEEIQELLCRSRKAQQVFEQYPQERVDECCRVIGKIVSEHAAELAQEAVDETGLGNYKDKISKNKGKPEMVWYAMRGKKSRGIIERDEAHGIVKVAKPIGVIGAVTPTTNPTITPSYNAMIALKAGNSILVCPHPRAKKVTAHTCELMREALKEIGAPEDLILCVEEPTLEKSQLVMQLCDSCISTGGPGMVKAAYSSGKPAFGVGQGNVQCIVDTNVDQDAEVSKIIESRIYDNGVICAGAQDIICGREKYDEVVRTLAKNKAFYIDEPELRDRFRAFLFPGGSLNKDVVGKFPTEIAKMAGIDVPEDTRVIVVKAEGPGKKDLFSKEKLCPVLGLYVYDTWEEAVEIAYENLELEGAGHSVSLHSSDDAHIEYAAIRLPASRFVVNQISSKSIGGAYNNGLNPAATLGCGTWGNNSISENLWYTHLMNVSRIAYIVPDAVVPSDEEIWNS